MTSAQRDGKRAQIRIDPVCLLAPPLNAANDNEREVRLVSENWGLVTAIQLRARVSSKSLGVVSLGIAIVVTLALGWIWLIALTLLDNVSWALRFFEK